MSKKKVTKEKAASSSRSLRGRVKEEEMVSLDEEGSDSEGEAELTDGEEESADDESD